MRSHDTSDNGAATLFKRNSRASDGQSAGSPGSDLPSPRERKRIARSINARRDSILSRWWDNGFDQDRLARYSIPFAREMGSESIKKMYVEPLLNLLVAFVDTGQSRYLDTYLDERLRYAPHKSAPAVRAAFFNETLPLDAAAVLNAVAPVLGREGLGCLERILSQVHSPLLAAPNREPVRILAMGDCLMTQLRSSVQAACRRAGLAVDMRNLYFSALVGTRLSASQCVDYLSEFRASLIAMSFLTFEGVPAYSGLIRELEHLGRGDIDRRVSEIADLITSFLSEVRDATDAPFILHNASGLPLTRARKHLLGLAPISRKRAYLTREINLAIQTMAESTRNVIVLDEYSVACSHGHRACDRRLIPKTVVRDAFFHTTFLSHYLAKNYCDIISSYSVLGKAKVLLVDFDNTLWDGVMAEGPVTHRVELQRLLRRVRESGVLLVALSKNDPANIRWEEMVLKPDDFVLRKIGWDPKPQFVLEAASELDLGLDTFVMIDDNPVERELVASQFPQVRTLDPAGAETPVWIERMLQFPNTRLTDEAAVRTQMYAAQIERRKAMSQSIDHSSTMMSLGLVVRFGRGTRSDLERITELVQRTNQFNTTTIRYSRRELTELVTSKDHRVYVAELADKFGNLGIVCAAVLRRHDATCTIESFVLSCRAMGFNLERLVMSLLVQKECGASCRLIGLYFPTDRNTPAKDLFKSCGFAASGDEWLLHPGSPAPDVPPWFTVLDRPSGGYRTSRAAPDPASLMPAGATARGHVSGHGVSRRQSPAPDDNRRWFTF
jgi:FkbH-like protein